MQRVHAIVLVLALLATPLSLLARATSGMGSDCNNLCCLAHGSHAGHSHAAPAKPAKTGMACHHGSEGHAIECTMKATHQGSDLGFLAPIAPTAPSAFITMGLPLPARASQTQPIELHSSGFLQRLSNLRAVNRSPAVSSKLKKSYGGFHAGLCAEFRIFFVCSNSGTARSIASGYDLREYSRNRARSPAPGRSLAQM